MSRHSDLPYSKPRGGVTKMYFPSQFCLLRHVYMHACIQQVLSWRYVHTGYFHLPEVWNIIENKSKLKSLVGF